MHAKISQPTLARIARNTALGIMLLTGTAICMQAHAQLPPLQQQGSIDYVSGGIGTEESTAFKEAMPQFPLALTFASRIGEAAAYVADVQVVIRDSHDTDVLNVKSKGPYFLVKLPPGQYRVFATYNNKTQSQKVDIGTAGTRRAMFEWK